MFLWFSAYIINIYLYIIYIIFSLIYENLLHGHGQIYSLYSKHMYSDGIEKNFNIYNCRYNNLLVLLNLYAESSLTYIWFFFIYL